MVRLPYARLHTMELDIDVSDLMGIARVIEELRIRKHLVGADIPQSYFRRLCKRAGIGTTEARKILRHHGYIENYVYPLRNTLPVLPYGTYEDWYALGFQVARGETSHGRTTQGVAVFHKGQVYKRCI